MPTRRETMIGAGSLLLGSGILTSGAFAGESTTPTADFRVIATPRLVLVPGRDDQAHVTVESDGEYDHVRSIDLSTVNGRARTAFGDIVEVINDGEAVIDELYFKLEVESDTEDADEIAAALSIVASDETIPATGESNFLTIGDADGDDSDILEPEEAVPFGIEVDVSGTDDSSLTELPDSDSFEVTLQLSTEPAE